MTTAQTITQDFDEEMTNTRKLLERVPLNDAYRDYKPHEKSMAMARLATHVAELPSWHKIALESQLLQMQDGYQPRIAQSTAELLEIFDKSVETGRAWLNKATDEDMEKDWTFKYGDRFSFTSGRRKVVRSFLNHLVHHRAQLGVYLRLNNIPVPGMYGPSADDTW